MFLFDEAWAAFYRQHQLIAMFLGSDYQVMPDFWVWHVDPRAGQAGWRPHRDKGRRALAADGSPLSLTMWVPMSEASPLNGCMYILPANRDPVYGTANEAAKTVSGIAGAMQQLPPAVTKTTQKLLAKGYLREVPSADDARSKLLFLTPRGRTAHGKAIAALLPELAPAFSGWTPAELEQFWQYLDRLKVWFDRNR